MAEGYSVPLSAAPGETIEFHVSASSSYTRTYFQLGVHGDEMTPMSDPMVLPAHPETTPDQPWLGCGWGTAFALTVPPEWPSGYYSARCTDGGGDTDIVFIVKPASVQAGRIAALASTNTWNAYNNWGGRSKYEPPGDVVATLSFERPSNTTSPVDNGTASHTTRAELWIMGFLIDAGYGVDVYTDADFHVGITDLNSYPVLLLNTHSEYWTQQMRDRLVDYLDAGGSLVNLAGNVLFERVELDLNDNRMIALNGDDNLNRALCFFRNLNPPQPEHEILGVSHRDDNFGLRSSYAVRRADHRYFNNTGLSDYDEIGIDGLNGAADVGVGASGWEMATSDPGTAPDGVILFAPLTGPQTDRGSSPANTILLARGTNVGPDGAFGADMVTYRTDAGGQVFSVGSISFGGSLVIDANLQTIVRNVLDECLGVVERPDERVGFMHLIYGGNGTTPVDSGLPGVGQMFSVETRGNLHWYLYGGSGQNDPEATGLGWNSNSSNIIGIGWDGFRTIIPQGDGVLLGVSADGNLVWYQYNGAGESDPAATGLGWSRNSGNLIGIGWADFRFLCAKPWEGRVSTNDSAIYGVDTDGKLHWYRYIGEGESDPAGTGPFWHPNSGNIIGVGWFDGFRRMVAISDIILLVEDGGNLRWYRYGGHGESDPDATGLGWHPNSGNVIGTGWNAFRHIFGGSDGKGGYVIYAAEDGGILRWYRYTGTGESDPSGTSAAWSENSGNMIGIGW
jgi:hypothetical protein